MIYTSYWSNVRKLEKAGIEPVAISRGKPKGWRGRSFDYIAPTWKMLKMSDEDYDREYESILSELDQSSFVSDLMAGGEHDVAMLCWEKNPADCHRTRVGEWLREAGFEVEEFDPRKKPVDKCEQDALF